VKSFFDTNILIYGQQKTDKGSIARKLLMRGGTVSVQVLNEFTAVARRKLGYSWDSINDAIDDVLALVAPPLPLTIKTHSAAREIAKNHGFSFYDALIVAAALEAGCDTLYSEDMQHGRVIGRLILCNPFLENSL
jgi:predicted nucleic acid-binding protein